MKIVTLAYFNQTVKELQSNIRAIRNKNQKLVEILRQAVLNQKHYSIITTKKRGAYKAWKKKIQRFYYELRTLRKRVDKLEGKLNG